MGIDILRQERGHPHGREQENDVEQRVVVLRAGALVVLGFGPILRVIIVIVVESVGGETACFDRGAQRFGAHLAATVPRLLLHESVLAACVGDLGVCVAALGAEGDALRGGAGGGVGDGEHGDDGADDNGDGAGATRADQRVAVLIVWFHGYGGHGEVGAVDGDHGGLGESSLRVEFLDGGVDGYGGDDEENN